jgi:hypothetical protein
MLLNVFLCVLQIVLRLGRHHCEPVCQNPIFKLGNELPNNADKNCFTGRHEIEPVHAADTDAGSMAQLTSFMMTPTTAELRTAIEVLKALDQRVCENATHSAEQLPNTKLGGYYSAKLEARTNEQVNHIEVVTTQLQNWREELLEEQKHHMTQSV